MLDLYRKQLFRGHNDGAAHSAGHQRYSGSPEQCYACGAQRCGVDFLLFLSVFLLLRSHHHRCVLPPAKCHGLRCDGPSLTSDAVCGQHIETGFVDLAIRAVRFETCLVVVAVLCTASLADLFF